MTTITADADRKRIAHLIAVSSVLFSLLIAAVASVLAVVA